MQAISIADESAAGKAFRASFHDARHFQQILSVARRAAPLLDLVVEEEFVVLVAFFKVPVRYGGGVALYFAKLEVVRGDEGDEVRACEARNGFSCADEAIGAVCALEDLVDDDEHGFLLFLESHHAFDAQDLRIEGGESVCGVVRHADRGEKIERGEAKAFARHGCPRIGEDAGARDRAQIRRLA